MKLLKEQVMWDYYSKFDPILDKYVPARGEGETIASQIVTAVNKLVYKWYNDGDVYDNTKYLKGWANDLSSYANWLYKHLGSVLKGTLSRIFVDETEDDYEETLKELADKTLDETFLSKFENQPKLGSIYECDGPFKFIDREDEEDEDDGYYDESCKSKKMSKRVLKEKAWEKEVPADIATAFRKAIDDDGAQMKNIIAGVTPLLDWIAEECPDCESDVDIIRDDLQVIDPEASSTDLFADDVDDGTNEEYFNDCILNPIYDLCDELNIWIPTLAMMDESVKMKKVFDVAIYDNQNNLVDYYTIEADNDGEAEKEALDLAWEASDEWYEIDHMSNDELADFDIEEAKEAWKDMHYAAVVGANVMKENLKDSLPDDFSGTLKDFDDNDLWNKHQRRKSIEFKATELVKDYYNHEFDLPTLHQKLKDLFGSTKEAVIWFAENDEKIKNKNLNESTWGQIIKPMGNSASKKLEFITKQNLELFDELNEEVEDTTNGIIEHIFVDEYRLNKSEILGRNITEEEYKNAVKQMYKVIDKYYRKCNGNEKLSEDYSDKQSDANTSLDEDRGYVYFLITLKDKDGKEYYEQESISEDIFSNIQSSEEGPSLKEYFQEYYDDEVINVEQNGYLKEDTVKQGNVWVNKGKEGTHGKFKTKKEADDQRKAMFAQGYREDFDQETNKKSSQTDKIVDSDDFGQGWVLNLEETPFGHRYIRVYLNGTKVKEYDLEDYDDEDEAFNDARFWVHSEMNIEGLEEKILLDDDQELEDDLSDDEIKELECFAANVIKEKGQPVSENISGNIDITVDDDEPVVDYVNENVSQAKEK